MLKKSTSLILLFILFTVWLSGCSPASTSPTPVFVKPTSAPATKPLPSTPVPAMPTNTPLPQPTRAASPAAGGITSLVARVVQEQGSGAACSPNATYFVFFDVAANGPTTAKYEVSATDASGQVENGVFDTFDSPYVTDVLKFVGPETQTVSLRLKGPYAYPDAITIRARANGGDVQVVPLSCKSAEGKSEGGSNGSGGIANTAVKVVQEQGSGAVCSPNATYFVYFDITANGPTTTKYEVSATDVSGQVEDGVFDGFESSDVSDRMKFDAAGMQTVSLRLIGPYSYPDTITIRARVNGGDVQTAQVACK
jgi:hypothetical protein